MSAIHPKYLTVQRDDVERVGLEAAYLLAVVRYVTGLPGEHNGRVEIDGQMCWQASHTEIADALGGTSRQKVGRIVRQLESDGELLGQSPDAFYGDQTKAYRIVDLQCSNLNTGDLTSSPVNRTGSPMNRTGSPMNRDLFTSEHSSSLTEELSEETEEIDYRAIASDCPAGVENRVGFYRQAQQIVTHHVHYKLRIQRNRSAFDRAVDDALTRGLDENTIIAAIQEWNVTAVREWDDRMPGRCVRTLESTLTNLIITKPVAGSTVTHQAEMRRT
jgi:hypothetical protein